MDKLSESMLVQRSVDGDRQAFEEIVARNASPVSAVAYALTGDAALSEDITQEVFLTAWQKLRDLREPEKLRSWLCAIARNVAHRFGRNMARDPLSRAEELNHATALTSSQPTAHELASVRQQQELVWATIATIPENYRLPLVLYYREGRSTAEVAHALELTEETVRQRLARARALVRSEVLKTVEDSLESTRPSPTLVAGIVAALGTATLQASAAATSAAAAKAGTAVVGGAAFTGAVLGTIIGPVVGMGGAVVGCAASLQRSKTPAQRGLVWRSIWATCGLVVAYMGALSLTIYAGHQRWMSLPASLWTGGAVIVSYIVLLVGMVLHYNRKGRALVEAECGPIQVLTPKQRHRAFIEVLNSRAGRYNKLVADVGAIFGGISCILAELATTGSWAMFGVVVAYATGVIAISLQRTFARPENYLLHLAVAMLSVPVAYVAVSAYWWSTGVRKMSAFVYEGLDWHFATSPFFPAAVSMLVVPFAIGLLVRHFRWTREHNLA